MASIASTTGVVCAAALCAVAACASAAGRGVSPYVALSLDPEMEQQIERVLVLADVPVLRRPVTAAAVLDALPKACEKDAGLCAEVRRYLGRYMASTGVTHFGLDGAVTGGSERGIPNLRGMDSSSAWQASASLFWQPSDYFALNLGGVAFDGDSVPVNSFVSLGSSYAQLDIGYRDHWWSPFTDSSMLIGTNAATTSSFTLSNYTPMTRLGLRYELFLTRLSHSDRIAFEDGFTSGRPRLLGTHLSIEPARGWSLGVSRIMQFGGGARGGSSLSDILKAFVRPSDFDNVGAGESGELGNQLASITSRFVFPGARPFAVYFEYAGEDTSRGRDYLLGNSALSAGITLPDILPSLDLSLEASEWQNGWYVNHIYGDGLRNEGSVLGHWAGDQRAPGEGVGGSSHSVRLGWKPAFGGQLSLRYRSLSNESYSATDYERGHDVTLRYAYPVGMFSIGAEALAGRDVFGEDFSRVGLFIQQGDFRVRSAAVESRRGAARREAGAELFVDAGVNVNEVDVDVGRNVPRAKTGYATSSHFALGARRAVTGRSDLGVRVELDQIDGNLLMGFRALDYRYRFAGPLAIGGFLGAARYDLDTPAYGIYGGVGAQWRDVLPGWDVGLDLRYALKVARDRLLPTDPDDPRPDLFYDISSATLSLSRRF